MLEVEVADPQLGAAGVLLRNLDDLETLLGAQDLERLWRVAGSHDRLEEAGPDRPGGRVVHHPIGADDPAVRRHTVPLEGQPERLGEVDH